jgi:hypothetical protein
MQQFCYSCGIFLALPDTQGTKDNYCKHCLNEKGEVKSSSEVLAGLTEWILSWQPAVDRDMASQRAAHYMEAMPHWAV